MISNKTILKCKKLIDKCDVLLIGAGSGLSTAAGLSYSGKSFTDNFADYIQKYNLTDMYTAGFFPFPTLEEKWGYFSRHIKLNRYDAEVGKVYNDLMKLVKIKNYFVITTNVDAQFFKAGFDQNRVFATQGDYGKFQCSKPCHDTLYDNEAIISQMVQQQFDCRIPTELIPMCPVCGENLITNIRINDSFVENDDWKSASTRYSNFIDQLENKKVVLLELGVGFNTPIIIRWPFEKITELHNNCTLIRVNYNNVQNYLNISDKSLHIEEDIADFFENMTLIL